MKPTGGDRNQSQVICLGAQVAPDSHVRAVGAFVDFPGPKALGFEVKGEVKNGRPAYTAEGLLGLYCYGCPNRARSSRRLGREAGTNAGAMWLLRGRRPATG